jgi:hypothetical protein
MKFILKHGKTDKDIHNLRQEIEVTADVFLHGLQIWAIFCKKKQNCECVINWNSSIIFASVHLPLQLQRVAIGFTLVSHPFV